MHDHLHALDERRARNRGRIWVALALNAAMFAAAIVGGILTGSLALLAEGGHVLSDVAAIAVGLVAASLAAREPTPARTFGYQRVEIFGALLNGVTLVVISILIVIGAIARLSDPPDVAGWGVLVLGVVGLAGNAAATWVLWSGEREDINLEGVLRHSAADALGSLGVIVAGALVLTTGWDRADAVVSLAIAALIAAGSWRLVKEPVEVLMEAAPAGIDVREVGRAMCADADVVEVHDLHVWAVTSGFPALAAHIVVRGGSDRDLVRARIEQLLRERFGIGHTTLQVVETGDDGDLIPLQPIEPAQRGRQGGRRRRP
jgi:cobalt-zinc-cadmium efflux system protein